jgi:hypothetical protein
MTLFVQYKAVCDACGAVFKEENYELSSARFVLPEPHLRRNQIADVLACDRCLDIATGELVKLKLKENT